MLQESFEKYLSQIQELYMKSTLEECLALINRHLNQQGPLKLFFQGEQAFYKGDYELSLKYYLQAHETPCFQFFCYRASAFVAKKMGQKEKAISLGKKALSIHPKDFPSLSLFTKELVDKLPKDEAEKYRHTHNSLLSKSKSDEIETPRIALGTKELDDLALIFRDQPQEVALVETESQQEYLDSLEAWKLHISKKQCLYVLDNAFFLRLNGKGILIHPEKHFLNSFHAKGLSLQDVHWIIGNDINIQKPIIKNSTQLDDKVSFTVLSTGFHLQNGSLTIGYSTSIDHSLKNCTLLIVPNLIHTASGHTLPSKNGLCIDLETLEVQCTVSGFFSPLSQIRIVKQSNSILYLNPHCIL